MTDTELEALKSETSRLWQECVETRKKDDEASGLWLRSQKRLDTELETRRIEAEVQKRLKEAK